jgi:hypothetical protein
MDRPGVEGRVWHKDWGEAQAESLGEMPPCHHGNSFLLSVKGEDNRVTSIKDCTLQK